MKTITKALYAQLHNLAVICLTVSLATGITSCNNGAGTDQAEISGPAPLLLIIGDDVSRSTQTLPTLDTAIIRRMANKISSTGGTLVVYKIGNPTDRRGIRCTLQRVSMPDHRLTMEAQIEQQKDARKIEDENSARISGFMTELGALFSALPETQLNTDLEGFFHNVDLLLEEPQYQHHSRIVFVISDGIQSINHEDHPCRYSFSANDFSLGLCGWKVKLPDSVDVMQFESPSGFTEYFNDFFTN